MLALGSRTAVNLPAIVAVTVTVQANSRPHAPRLSDEVSDNRHGQRWTSADTHGWSAAGHACCGAGSPRLYLASGRRGPRPRARDGPDGGSTRDRCS